MTQEPLISVFDKGYMKTVKNKKGEIVNKAIPQCHPTELAVPLTNIYDYIRGDSAKEATETLRLETNPERQQEMKILNFRYCTPGGIFRYRNNERMESPSGMMVIDIDGIDEEDQLLTLREALIHDRHYETELLFTSPRGKGIKWFISITEMGDIPLGDIFRKVSRHLQFEYGIIADESGKDCSRACFLSYDPTCYINPKYLYQTISL